MVRLVSLLLFFGLTGSVAMAQTAIVTGSLVDNDDKSAMVGATVTLVSLKDSTIKYRITSDNNGSFTFSGIALDTFTLKISSVGYSKMRQTVVVDSTIKNLGTIDLFKSGKELADVVVVAQAPPVTQKGDTIQYSASQYKVNPDANAQDLITKMPGITVDQSGTVTAHGDQVKSVTVDGKKFYGDDATAALQNLPADIIDKIQVFDKLSDQAAFTGFDDGNSVRAINIVTKANMRNGQFGRLFAGYGTDGKYNAGGNVNFFNKDRRISLVGLFNNINQQNFSSQDLLGFSNSGGGGRGGGGQRPGSSSAPQIGQQSGISATNAFGINYSDMWGKKLTVQGSYFFNNSNVNNDQVSSTQYFLSDTSNQFVNQHTTSRTKNFNHRINLRFDYMFDSANLLTITPVLSFQNNHSNTGTTGNTFSSAMHSISDTTANNTLANASGYNINNNILFRHAFAKKGRTISFNFGTVLSKNDGNNTQQTFTQYYRDSININDSTQNFYTNTTSNGYQLTGNAAYTEPIGKKGQLQLNYTSGYTKNNANTGFFQYDSATKAYSNLDTTFSNKFENTVTTQSPGVSYRIGDKNNMLAVGVSYLNTLLSSNQQFPVDTSIKNRSFNNVLPNLMWRKKLSNNATLRVLYRGTTVVPTISQLQNVANISNGLFVTIGNPLLKQQTTNTLSTRYTFTNTKKSTSFFANVYLQQISNYIGSSTFIAAKDSTLSNNVVLKAGSQLTKPVNLDGYLSLRSFFTYGLPLSFIKSTVNLNAGFSLSAIPGIVNNVNTISNNFAYTGGVVIASNISQYIDFTLSYSGTYNVIQPQQNKNYFSQTIGIKFNLLDKKGWFFNNDLSNQSYSGLSAGFNQSYWLWNVAAGKKFFKKQNGELKLSVFDLLNQNQSIVRTVTGTYIEDDQNLVLKQYAMLTFTYTLKSFGTPPPAKGGRGGGYQRQGPPGGGGPGF
ncbi:MAG TPA: outer membrane beta-barrel protein [Ferruginibacter sp.]|nr:outer membrane beta-barrel protein [Ferruginibacter sp.]